MARDKYELHGEAGKYAKTTEYSIYCNMLSRCRNPKSTFYEYYGGRGISVCERWRDSFSAFLCDTGRRPSEEHTLDRIDNDGDYEPGNVRWATRREQLRNRRDNRIITANGRTMCLQDWANETGLNPSTIHKRLSMGWETEDAVSVKKFTGRCVGSPGFTKQTRGRKIQVGNQSLTIKQWSIKNGVPKATIMARLYHGWSEQKAVSAKSRAQKDPAAPGEVILG